MKRVLAVVSVSIFVVTAFTVVADAQRRRRRAPRQQQQPTTPMSPGLSDALDPIEWGWSPRKLVTHFRRQIREEYRDRIAKAPGAIEEDRLGHERDVKMRRLRESYVRFDGTTTGHDSGFLRDEFTHGNGEAMVRVRNANSDDYYFFINNKLWKWYRAFGSHVFQGADFEQFGSALQGRFGEARLVENQTLQEGGRELTWLEWQDEQTRARAIDNNSFYGFYCLVFESKSAVEQLPNLRRNTQARGRRGHALVEAVTSGEEGASSDGHQDVVDRITGNIRRRVDAPEDSNMRGRASGMSASSQMSAGPAPANGGRSSIDDDPLSGL